MAGKAKIAVIGIGNMGNAHMKDYASMEGVELIVCDIDGEKADAAAARYGVKAFHSSEELFAKGGADGVVIATPHYDHTTIAVEAFSRGISVLSEKPIAVHVNDAKRMISAYEAAKGKKPDLVFEAMFQQRTQGNWIKTKELINSGELGRLVRATWIITDWFRTQNYYDSGGWRATWKGEGGGVLMNQCPHNLDLFQWFVGMPDKVTGFASLGKRHDIEVEDEVTAIFEYGNGMTGHFITTTAEAPGTNRLEIVGEHGKLVYEDGKLVFTRNRVSMLDFLKNSTASFAKPESWRIEVPIPETTRQNHRLILEDFRDAIRDSRPPMIDAREGINMVSLDNAIMLSSFKGEPVELPLDGDEFEAKLKELASTSRYVKKETKGGAEDIAGSFAKG